MSNTEEVVYACAQSPGFSFRVEDTRFKFNKHELRLTDSEQIELVDKAIAESATLRRMIKKVDVSVAEALVAEHRRTHGGAVQGPFNSEVARKMEQRDEELVQAVGEQGIEQLQDKLAQDSELVLTEKSNSVPTQKPSPVKLNTLTERDAK